MANALIKTQTSTLYMEISPISKLTTVWSPEIIIHGIPWQVKAFKNEKHHSLSVDLHCAIKDDSSDWAVPAYATITLMPLGEKKNSIIERDIPPRVFNPSSFSYGFSKFIRWCELTEDKNNKYVQNDTIELKIEITAENPKYLTKSSLKFETISKSCDCGSPATFRLTVKNVKNLLAVRSPRFTVRDLTWDLTVYKSLASTLGIVLSNKTTEKESCKIKMSIRLLSSIDDVDSIKKSIKDGIEDSGHLRKANLIWWTTMLKPNNGFVKNDSITLVVEINTEKPDGDIPKVDPHHVAKRRRFECSICFKCLDNQDISTTSCGHLFCTACITEAVKNCSACPMCQKEVTSVQQIYLPTAK